MREIIAHVRQLEAVSITALISTPDAGLLRTNESSPHYFRTMWALDIAQFHQSER